MLINLSNKASKGDPKAILACVQLLDKVGYLKMSNEDVHRGMLVVPGPIDPKEWEKAAAKTMAKVRGEIFDAVPDF